MLSNIFTWINAIPKVTKILSNSAIDVRYKGDGAYTVVDKDGKPTLINLPTLPNNVTQKELDLTFGYMFHELGHVNYTDFSVGKKHNVNMKSGLGNVFNILEDTFVERKISPDYLEAKQYLLHCQNFIKDFTEQAIRKIKTPQDLDLALLIPKIRYLAGQTSFYDLLQKYPTCQLGFLDKYENDIKNINSTEDSYKLAEKIYKELKRVYQELKDETRGGGTEGDGNSGQQEADGSNDSQSNTNQDQSESSEQSSGEQDDKSDKSSGNQDEQNSQKEFDSKDKNTKQKHNTNDNGQKESDSKNKDKKQGQDGKPNSQSQDGKSNSQDKDDKSNSQGQNGAGKQNPDTKKLDEALANIVKDTDAFKEIRAAGTKDTTNKADGGEQEPTGPCIILKDFNSNTYRVVDRSKDGFWEVPSQYSSTTVEKMMPNVNILMMKQRLIRLFAARNKSTIIKGIRRGKLCNSNLFRLRLDDDRVFKRKFESEQLNTAITLLIDCSGSMSGGQDKCAISAALLFAKILETINIPCEVLGFSTGRDIFHGQGRNVSVKIGIFKLFNEKLIPKVLGRFCNFWNGNNHANYYNCNDDGESILLALTNLVKRPEQRKMIFVMSDGQPNVGGCNGEELNHLRDVVKSIEKEPNFEIYGIGIQTRAVQKFYSNYSILDNPEDLSKVIIEQLSKNIL